MNEFENKLILKEERYESGLFPQIPNFRKRGSAFVLTEGSNDDILVTEHTTTKQIRKGKYNMLIEISTLPYMKELTFTSPSKEAAYSFDVYVKAVIQVDDPIRFYENRNLDVDAYFNNLFLLDVKKVTRRYSILSYDGMDNELTRKLSSYNTIDAATGFSYTISVVDAQPGEQAQEYVERYSKQQLDASLKKNARELSKGFSVIFEEAVMTEVAEGRLSEMEAIVKIQEYNNSNFETKMNQLNKLREDGLITDKYARDSIKTALRRSGLNGLPEQEDAYSEYQEGNDSEFDDFYEEEE
ncbi:hypothetical protein [Candidatus Merdisoma sp. JLR.KK006]|uniref:hypothetical protein n=1 Tax=Candidatus Merdisoma sp. JLR.KK006 TaxID=3112626 RepID=UPI002FEED82E